MSVALRTLCVFVAQAGAFREIQDVTLAREQGYDVAMVRTRFEEASLDVKVVFGSDGRIAGLFFLPAASSLGSSTEYVAPDLVGLDGTVTPEEEATLSELRTAVDRVKDPGLSPSTDAPLLPLGIPAPYWLDLRVYDPVAVAAGLAVPIAGLQGGRDYQVTQADFALWQAGLGGDPLCRLLLYDDLNHLFMAGEGLSTPAEYDIPGPVDRAVVEDVSAWVVR